MDYLKLIPHNKTSTLPQTTVDKVEPNIVHAEIETDITTRKDRNDTSLDREVNYTDECCHRSDIIERI
jgi:hypothetical protein